MLSSSFFFFFNDTATTEIYTLSLHDALPISPVLRLHARCRDGGARRGDHRLLHAGGEPHLSHRESCRGGGEPARRVGAGFLGLRSAHAARRPARGAPGAAPARSDAGAPGGGGLPASL